MIAIIKPEYLCKCAMLIFISTPLFSYFSSRNEGVQAKSWAEVILISKTGERNLRRNGVSAMMKIILIRKAKVKKTSLEGIYHK